MRVVASLALALAAVAVLVPLPAWAACAEETIEVFPATATVGGTVTVEGEGFGTACYDEGPPPEGMGVLGEPATGIEIIVRDGPVEWVLARGDADSDYTFTTDIVVPPAEAGEVVVVAAYDAALTPPGADTVLQVTGGEAAGQAISTFGPSAGAASPGGRPPGQRRPGQHEPGR